VNPDMRMSEHDALAYAESIIATLREPFLVLEGDLRVRTANGAFYRGFRVSKDETEDRFVYDLGNGQWNIPRLRTLLTEILSNSQSIEDFEVEHDFPGLGRRSMLLNARTFPPESTDPYLVLLAIEDITERKHTRDALRDSFDRLEKLFDASPISMYLVDAELRIRLVSRNARPVFGDIGELVGRRFADVIHMIWPPIVADEIVARFEHTLRTGEPYAAPEFSEVRSDRQVREYYDWQIHRIALPVGQFGVVCYFMDISTRIRAEEALRDSEVRYRRLFEHAKDGILILDAGTGKVIDANPFMTDLLGYSHDEFLGKELWEIGLFRDIHESQSAYRELQEKGYLRYEDLPLESRTGQKVEVEFVSNVYPEDHHQVVQCNIRDITERSRLQRLTQEQAAALTDLDRRKDEFLAMLSHELRNPLAAILNAALLLRLHTNQNRLQGIENPALQQSGQIIERQVGQLVRIVDELLEVSRITTGRIQLNQQRIVLGVVVDHSVSTVRSLIDQRKHELTVSVPTEAIWIVADAARLEQVMVNLLTNAAKYTDPGGRISVTVELEEDAARGKLGDLETRRQGAKDKKDGNVDSDSRRLPTSPSYVLIRVRDTGVGMIPEILPHIFDLFTQADRSLDRSQGGLGIGLALVRRLVELHQGTVEVSSVLGQGSEFVVRLPIAPSPQSTSTPHAQLSRPTSGSSLRVMVVDDNVDTVATLAMLLQVSGHEVRTVFDGLSVLKTALDFQPNVVLLDIGLPGLNGFLVAKQLRQKPAFKNTLLVAMSGYGREIDRQNSKEAGFDHHLVKPCDFADVVKILATVSVPPAG